MTQKRVSELKDGKVKIIQSEKQWEKYEKKKKKRHQLRDLLDNIRQSMEMEKPGEKRMTGGNKYLKKQQQNISEI